jgi:hypothetical protein
MGYSGWKKKREVKDEDERGCTSRKISQLEPSHILGSNKNGKQEQQEVG